MRLGLSGDYRKIGTTAADTPLRADLYGIVNMSEELAGDNSIAVSGGVLKTQNDRR
jgi:hypothetical protein